MMVAETAEFEKEDTPRRGQPSLDYIGVGALTVALIMIMSAILLGGPVATFLDPAAALIVIGGALAVAVTACPNSDILQAPEMIVRLALHRPPKTDLVAQQMVEIAEQTRKAGLMSLQYGLEQAQITPFLRNALQMAVDGLPPEQIERNLTDEIRTETRLALRASAVLSRAADAAPAMGLVGTLVGLVRMLSSLNDPTSIGGPMAVALLTTLYGVLLGAVVLGPLAGRMEANLEEEVTVRRLQMACALSVARQENPRRLEMAINAILPVNMRVRHFE